MRIKLADQSFGFIEVHKSNYLFEKVNSGPVHCRDCKVEIAQDLGIYRQSYKRNGYLCFICFARDVEIINHDPIGDRGFFIDTLSRLRACTFSRPTISTAEVVEAVYQSFIDREYTSLQIIGAPTHHLLSAAAGDTAGRSL